MLNFVPVIFFLFLRIFVDSDNEDDETKFVDDDDDDDEVGPSNQHMADDDDEEDELDKFMAGIEVPLQITATIFAFNYLLGIHVPS